MEQCDNAMRKQGTAKAFKKGVGPQSQAAAGTDGQQTGYELKIDDTRAHEIDVLHFLQIRRTPLLLSTFVDDER